MAEKKIQPMAPEKTEPAAGARAAEERETLRKARRKARRKQR